MGSFLLLGATWLGKSYTAKRVAQSLFEREDALIQYDMSEFSEKTSVSRLIGASPGYIGYEEGGKLVEKVKRNPYSVVVFDEAEKAHEDVLNLLLQILEEGKLTDNLGQVADFSNCLVFLTSNIGHSLYEDVKSMGFSSAKNSLEDMQKEVKKEAKKSFKLELLNRIDKIIPYNKLTHKELRKILNMEIDAFKKLLKKQGIKLRISSRVREDICRRAEEENMGARPLQRIFRQDIQSVAAKKIVEHNTDLNGFVFSFESNEIICEVE
jgi:ATP-dependent Clp protease ATP-binding subunit ClpC